jgi:flavin reductase (DIM6/NTAB) family NADH-FMN oxidoreductase RutF
MEFNPSEGLRQVMRQWSSGVAVVSAFADGKTHGMTVNSLVSISMEPPIVAVTLANSTKTHELVTLSQKFSISILSENQQLVSDIFAGKIMDHQNRFEGLDTFSMSNGAPLLTDGIGWLECKVIYAYSMPNATMFLGEVFSTKVGGGNPLVYQNRTYRKIC